MQGKFNKKTANSLLIITFSSMLFFSCTCGSPLQVTPIQRSDKSLDCGQIILEIAEAEQYRDYALKERSISMGEALMPVCWATGLVSGAKAANRANERVEYLGRLYETRGCVNEGRPFFKGRLENDNSGNSDNQNSTAQNQSYAPNNQNYSRQQSFANEQNFNNQPNYSRSPNYSNQPSPQSQQQYMQNMPPQNFGEKSQYRNNQYFATSQPYQSGQPVPQVAPHPMIQQRANLNENQPYYKLKNELGDEEMHEHKNRKNELYTHFHPHNEPHTHSED